MTGDVIYRLPAEMLVDLGYLTRAPDLVTPHYLYGRGTDCPHQVELPIRETYISCPLCAAEHQTSLLKRIFTAPHMHQVWHEHYNWTTGRPESDRRRMEHHLREASDRVSEETGIAHSFVRSDPSDLYRDREAKGADRKGKEIGSGARSTHDTLVKAGRRESKGRFVF